MIRMKFGDRLLVGSFYLVIAVFAAVCVIPFLLVLGSSFSDEISLLKTGYRFIPNKASLAAYRTILESDVIFRAYNITLFVTAAGTLLSMAVTCAGSYAVSVKAMKYRNAILFLVWATMLFSGGLVPWYILITKYLHLGQSLWVMIIPALVNPWYMFLLRNFFQAIPESLAESAKIDGANDIFILVRIILPLSLPALATIGLFYALDYWNEWFKAILFIDDAAKYPLQSLVIRLISSINTASEMHTGGGAAPAYTIRMATVVLTVGPIVFLYPFVQNYFIKGMTVGAVKG